MDAETQTQAQTQAPRLKTNLDTSFLKLIGFGLSFTAKEAGLLLLGCVVSFGVSIVAIKFLMGYIKKHDFKVFGYYRIALGAVIIIAAIVQMIIA